MKMELCCTLEQTTVKETTSSPYGCTDCKQQKYRGNGWCDAHRLLFLGMLVQGNRPSIFMFSWKLKCSQDWMVPNKHLVCILYVLAYSPVRQTVTIWLGLLCSDMDDIQWCSHPGFGRAGVLVGAACQINRLGESPCLIYYHHTGHR